MKNASFRQKLLTSFLAIGILPLLICTLLMLNIFRLSLTRSAADAAETQLDAMSGELSGLLSDCETVMEKLCAEPAVAAALDRSELDEQRVYSVLYRAAAPVLGGASLSVYGADGRQLYSTSSQPASGSLSPRWGLLAATAVWSTAAHRPKAPPAFRRPAPSGGAAFRWDTWWRTSPPPSSPRFSTGSTPPPAAFCCWTPSGIRCTPRPTSPPRR